MNVPGRVKRNLALKQRDRGFDEATYIERFLVLNAAGGDCLEDFECLREDRGVAAMLGHEVPSPEAARKFPYQFHDAEKIAQAQRELPLGEVSDVPEESTPLRGLAQVNQDVVRGLARRCAGERIATIDMDATVIESWQREASSTCEGGSGYQPMVALWAELNVVVGTNLWDWKPKRLLKWHREKAGSIEAVHDVLKNEVAGGVLPCGRYGANAAWFRLAVITYNVLTAMKRLVLPPDLQAARPKRLRFLIFQQPGKLIHHARKTVLRLAKKWNRISNWKHAMEVLALPAPV